MDKKRLEEVDKWVTENISPTFCASKWLQVTLYLHQGLNHSCYHCKVHPSELDTPSAIHNTVYKKEQRQKMLDGERPGECHYCWNLEDLGHHSDRHIRNAEYWANPHLEELANTPISKNVNPRHLEINFSNLCNFACSYCCPGASSRWVQEVKKLGDYPIDNKGQYSIDNALFHDEEDNPYIDAFWEWLPEMYEDLNVLRFTGGEPLLSKNVYKIFDYVNANPKPNLELSVNSNLGIPARNVDKFVETVKPMVADNTIKEFLLFTSIDCWGPAAEWARNGLDLNLWKRNLEYYLENVPGKVSLMITHHINSFAEFRGLLEYILEIRKRFGPWRLFMDTPYLSEPAHMTAFLATDELIEYIVADISFMEDNISTDGTGFSQIEVDSLKRVYEWILQNKKTNGHIDQNRADLYRFIVEHDKRRQTNYLEANPKMADFYALCKSIAEEDK